MTTGHILTRYLLVSSQKNVEWDSTRTLVDILGSIDVDVAGTIQDQISRLFNEKVSITQLNNYVASRQFNRLQKF